MHPSIKYLAEELAASPPVYLTFLSIADRSKNYYLSELLPYEPQEKFGDRLFHGIKEYDFLLRVTELSMLAVENDNLACFDPLVGENACQITAFKNCFIFSQFPVNSREIITRTRIVKEKVNSLLLSRKWARDEKTNLKFVLESENLAIDLSYSELYLVKSFLLTLVKTVKPPKTDLPFVKNEYTDFKKLKAIGPISTMFTESLIKKLRESLSAFSVSFIRELLTNTTRKPAISSQIACVQHKRLHCPPCYWVTRTLVLKSIESNTTIVLLVRQMAKDHNYRIIGETTLFVCGGKYVDEVCLNPRAAALILLVNACRALQEFSGAEQWKSELQQKNPIDLVLAYAAAHRQYPDDGKELEIQQLNDDEFGFYKTKAMEWGYSILNPSLFFLSHAFCDRIENTSKYTQA